MPRHAHRLILLAALLALAGAAQATTSKHPRKGTKQPRIEKGSGETPAERDRRLARECKGRPNAGACLGYGN